MKAGNVIMSMVTIALFGIYIYQIKINTERKHRKDLKNVMDSYYELKSMTDTILIQAQFMSKSAFMYRDSFLKYKSLYQQQ